MTSTTKQTIALLANAREVMQHMIATDSPLREIQERLINNLKAKLAGTPYAA